MDKSPDRYSRRSVRLTRYDYAEAGQYFVSICTQRRECLFGEIVDCRMQLNDAGRMVEQCWQYIPAHFSHVVLDEFIVMPNHIHGVITIGRTPEEYSGGIIPRDDGDAAPERRGTACRAHTSRTPIAEQFGKPVSGSIPTIIRSFKSAATKRINEFRNTSGGKVWQRNYYEHIIRNEKALNSIRDYIIYNPPQWESDPENMCRPEMDGQR